MLIQETSRLSENGEGVKKRGAVWVGFSSTTSYTGKNLGSASSSRFTFVRAFHSYAKLLFRLFDVIYVYL